MYFYNGFTYEVQNGKYRIKSHTKSQAVGGSGKNEKRSRPFLTVSLLPDFLIPWARVVTTVREAGFNRRKKGISFVKISQTIVSPSIGGISTTTDKRWWSRPCTN